MIKSLVLAAITTAGALGATGAHAGVSWSINIDTPVVGTVVSGGPDRYGHGDRYGHERVYAPVWGYTPRAYAPAPVYAPIYRDRPPVVYYPPVVYHPPVVYYPPAVVYRPVPAVYPRWRAGRHHGHDHWDGHGRR